MFYTSSLSRFSGRALRRVLQTSNYHRERGQGVPWAICFALLEIITGLPHGVGDWARQSTRTPAHRANVYRAAASISTARMPLVRAASMACAVSRKGASVAQL